MWRCSDRKSVCKKCLKDRAKEVRGSIRKQPVEIKVEDFIDLGEANFWFLDLIDPFSGMWVSCQIYYLSISMQEPFLKYQKILERLEKLMEGLSRIRLKD